MIYTATRPYGQDGTWLVEVDVERGVVVRDADNRISMSMATFLWFFDIVKAAYEAEEMDND